MRHRVLLPALLLTSIMHAQVTGFPGGLAANIGVSIPTGEFERTWGKNMFHAGANLAFPLGVLPIQGGLDLGYSIMGTQEATVPVTTDNLDITEGKLQVNCKVFSYHGLLRLSPLRTKVRPYVEGLMGFRQFSTTSKVTADGVEENISRTRNTTDLAFSKGWGAGVQMGLGSVGYLEVRVERFDSGEADYVDPTSISISSDGAVSYNTLTSNTDVTNILFGIGLRF